MSLTEREQRVFDAVVDYHARHGVWPTVRGLADDMQTREAGSERWSDDEVRGDLERVEAKAGLAQFRDEGERVRYAVKGREPHAEENGVT